MATARRAAATTHTRDGEATRMGWTRRWARAWRTRRAARMTRRAWPCSWTCRTGGLVTKAPHRRCRCGWAFRPGEVTPPLLMLYVMEVTPPLFMLYVMEVTPPLLRLYVMDGVARGRGEPTPDAPHPHLKPHRGGGAAKLGGGADVLGAEPAEPRVGGMDATRHRRQGCLAPPSAPWRPSGPHLLLSR